MKDNTLTCMPFDGRLCKLQSIIPSMATACFNKELIKRNLTAGMDVDAITDLPDYCFDCKVWTVPSVNDAMAWILYRQIDCIRNSKQQFAQTYVPHKELVGKDSDSQIMLCEEKTGYSWDAIGDNKKYGRLFCKYEVLKQTPDGVDYIRKEWMPQSDKLTDDSTREKFIDYLNTNNIYEK